MLFSFENVKRKCPVNDLCRYNVVNLDVVISSFNSHYNGDI